MAYVPTGKCLIAGQWVETEQTFLSQPSQGEAFPFFSASTQNVNQAVDAAEAAFMPYSTTSRAQRSAFLHAIADEIDARSEAITEIGTAETGLPEARLIGERGRTCGQLRMFAEHILSGDYLDRHHDVALPDRQPLPRADLRLLQQAVGPVAVFGASNFPLAFSTAGGDTASALAAGCPVVVKGHPAHPGTGEIIAEAILAAIESCHMPKGVFSLLQDAGQDFEVGKALVLHPLIKAVGFTGSLKGGRALFDLCASRPEPIPFFGELGSVNPMFVFPNALWNRGEALAKGWVGSLTMGAGQFCTNPGVAIVLAGKEADEFVSSVSATLATVPAQTMLTDGIASAYRRGKSRLDAVSGVSASFTSESDGRTAMPNLFTTTATEWLANPELAEEVFGPLGMVVIAESMTQMAAIAEQLEGQLTCTLHVDEADYAEAKALMPILARKAGRVLANAFPTGVEVCDAMVHGGPYPASTNFGATSVGTMAIRRFLRPVCYQDIPAALLLDDLN